MMWDSSFCLFWFTNRASVWLLDVVSVFVQKIFDEWQSQERHSQYKKKAKSVKFNQVDLWPVALHLPSFTCSYRESISYSVKPIDEASSYACRERLEPTLFETWLLDAESRRPRHTNPHSWRGLHVFQAKPFLLSDLLLPFAARNSPPDSFRFVARHHRQGSNGGQRGAWNVWRFTRWSIVDFFFVFFPQTLLGKTTSQLTKIFSFKPPTSHGSFVQVPGDEFHVTRNIFIKTSKGLASSKLKPTPSSVIGSYDSFEIWLPEHRFSSLFLASSRFSL